MKRTIYVVCFEAPGSAGGFDWYWNAAHAQAGEAECLTWPDVQNGTCALLRTAVQVPYGLDRDEITDRVDSLYYEQEAFMSEMWPNGYPTEELIA
jgi:hypothetical protein